MDREPGFYWVKVRRATDVEAARWTGECWLVTGNEGWLDDPDLAEIGPKIEPPQ